MFKNGMRGWLNLQTAYDLKIAEKANAKALARQVEPRQLIAA